MAFQNTLTLCITSRYTGPRVSVSKDVAIFSWMQLCSQQVLTHGGWDWILRNVGGFKFYFLNNVQETHGYTTSELLLMLIEGKCKKVKRQKTTCFQSNLSWERGKILCNKRT